MVRHQKTDRKGLSEEGGFTRFFSLLGNKTLAELRQFYFKLKEDVFTTQGIGGLGGYNTDELERILKEVLGTEKRMSDVKEPKYNEWILILSFYMYCFAMINGLFSCSIV